MDNTPVEIFIDNGATPFILPLHIYNKFPILHTYPKTESNTPIHTGGGLINSHFSLEIPLKLDQQTIQIKVLVCDSECPYDLILEQTSMAQLSAWQDYVFHVGSLILFLLVVTWDPVGLCYCACCCSCCGVMHWGMLQEVPLEPSRVLRSIAVRITKILAYVPSIKSLLYKFYVELHDECCTVLLLLLFGRWSSSKNSWLLS